MRSYLGHLGYSSLRKSSWSIENVRSKAIAFSTRVQQVSIHVQQVSIQVQQVSIRVQQASIRVQQVSISVR